jgi:hypothetical protein
MDEGVPVRAAVVGCLGLAVIGVLAVLLARPTILLFTDPRGDDEVALGPASMTADGPVAVGVVLGRSYGWDGEADAGGGRTELAVIVSTGQTGGPSTVAAASPLRESCPVEIAADRLVDCDGHAWTFEGFPIDPGDPPLDRIPTSVEDGQIVADFTRTTD